MLTGSNRPQAGVFTAKVFHRLITWFRQSWV